MTLGGHGTDGGPVAYAGRARTRERGRRRRRRRWVRGLTRLVFWGLVLAGVFVFGVGFGKTIGEGGTLAGESVTVVRDRGQLTATLPTKTIVETKTVTKIRKVRVRVRSRGRR